MNTLFIERNKQLLRGYARAAQIVGWLLIIASVAGAIFSWFNSVIAEDDSRRAIIFRDPSWFTLLLPAVIALGVSQFLYYLVNRNSRPGFLVRHGDKILYLYVIMIGWWTLKGYLSILSRTRGNPLPMLPFLIDYAFPMGLLAGAKVLSFVGLGQLYRRIRPTSTTLKSPVKTVPPNTASVGLCPVEPATEKETG